MLRSSSRRLFVSASTLQDNNDISSQVMVHLQEHTLPSFQGNLESQPGVAFIDIHFSLCKIPFKFFNLPKENTTLLQLIQTLLLLAKRHSHHQILRIPTAREKLTRCFASLSCSCNSAISASNFRFSFSNSCRSYNKIQLDIHNSVTSLKTDQGGQLKCLCYDLLSPLDEVYLPDL